MGDFQMEQGLAALPHEVELRTKKCERENLMKKIEYIQTTARELKGLEPKPKVDEFKEESNRIIYPHKNQNTSFDQNVIKKYKLEQSCGDKYKVLDDVQVRKGLKEQLDKIRDDISKKRNIYMEAHSKIKQKKLLQEWRNRWIDLQEEVKHRA